MQISKYLIYALCEPGTNEVRYVGKSCSGLQRPNAHLCKSVQTKTYLYNWVRSVQARGEQPVIKVLDETSTSDGLSDLEQFYIAYLRSLGARLTNLTNGGDGAAGRKTSGETRTKIAKANKRWLTQEAKEAIADKLREAAKSPEYKERLRAQAHKQYASEEGRNKASEGQCVRYSNPAERAKLSEAQKRRFQDPEQRKKASEIRKGKTILAKLKVIIDENGIVYPSVKAAAETLGICRSAISSVLTGRRKHARGHTFTYLDKGVA